MHWEGPLGGSTPTLVVVVVMEEAVRSAACARGCVQHTPPITGMLRTTATAAISHVPGLGF
jgi:hypothetical protein